MEYSFENFTILDKKKNGKADKIHFTVLEGILLRCDCVGVDLFNGLANAKPDAQICKDLYDASLVCKRWFLQNREVLHRAIVYDVLDNLVDKVNLSAVEVSTIQILRNIAKMQLSPQPYQDQRFPARTRPEVLCHIRLHSPLLCQPHSKEFFRVL